MKKTFCIFFSLIIIIYSVFGLNARAYVPAFEIKSKAVYLVNTDTDSVVYAKNENEKLYPASLTKIMTAIIVLERCPDKLDEEVTASKTALDELYGTGSSISGIIPGEILTVRQLLYCMLIPSGNDASVVLADYVSKGNSAEFIQMMNDKALELGLTNTHFTNSHGLHDPDHYTTAKDVYVMSKYAMNLPLFPEIVCETRYSIPKTNKKEKTTLVNKNLLMDSVFGRADGYYVSELNYQVKGIKTGTTDEAGYCLSSLATINGYTYMCVAMGAPSVDANNKTVKINGSFTDTRDLYKWVFPNFYKETVVSAKEPLCDIAVNLSWEVDKLQLNPDRDFTALLPKDAQNPKQDIKIEFKIPKSIDAPIKKGQVIGKADLMLAGEVIGEVDLIASESVEKSQVLSFLDRLNAIVSSPWFIIVAAFLVLSIIAYVVYAIIHNKKRNNFKKVKTYRKF